MTFLIIQLILLLLVLYPFLNQLFLYKKKQKLQEKLYKENLKVNPNIYKICINSEKFYKKILKFNIIENLGILIINEKNIKIQFYDKYNKHVS